LCVTDSIAKHNLKIRTHEDLLYKFVKLKLLKIKSIIVNSLLIWQLRLHAATYESTLFLYPIRLPNFLGHKIIQDWFIYNNWISSKCQIAYIFRTAFIEVIILVRIIIMFYFASTSWMYFKILYIWIKWLEFSTTISIIINSYLYN
jgi:hypothetical protein